MLEIRKASEQDIDLIQSLAHTIWPVAYKEILSPDQLEYMLELIYSKEGLNNQIKKLGHWFIIVYDNNSPVGFASYSTSPGSDHKLYRLQKLYVLPNQQGKGTGKFLVNYIIENIRPLGAEILELTVKRDNIAIQFYKKLGFTIAKEIDIDIGNGYFMKDYIMEKQLILH